MKASDFVRESFNYGLKLYGKMIVANIMCFIIVFSLTFLSAVIFSKEIGYKVSGVSPDGQVIDELYTHKYDDGVDNRYNDFIKQGYELEKTSIRSQVSGGARTFLQVVSQICCFGVLFSFVYPMFKSIGNKDRNLVNFGRINEDKLKGFKAGLFAIIPAVLVTFFIIATKNTLTADFSVSLFIYFNSSFYGIMDYLTNHVIAFKDTSYLSLILTILVQFIIPIVAHIGYILGYKDVSVKDRLVYKDKI